MANFSTLESQGYYSSAPLPPAHMIHTHLYQHTNFWGPHLTFLVLYLDDLCLLPREWIFPGVYESMLMNTGVEQRSQGVFHLRKVNGTGANK